MLQTTRRGVVLGVLLVAVAMPTHALISVAHGNRPVKNLGWPLGCEKVGNVLGRLGYTDGPSGGQVVFYYRSKSTEAFNAALEAFGGIHTPRLELVVHDGPGPEYRFGPEPKEGEKRPRVDWTFSVWHPEGWHRTFNNPMSTYLSTSRNYRQPVAAPRIDVYVGEGEIVWDGVVVPKHIHVTDRRTEAAPVRVVGGGMVVGDVYDMATGQPVAGAEVSVVRQGRGKREVVAHELTDALGAFEIRKIPAGRFLIEIRADGYAARGVGGYDNKGTSYHELLTELMREATVAGVVRDTAGKPIPGAEVTARSVLGIDARGYYPVDAAADPTDAQGRFTVRGLPTGYATLRCRKGTLNQRAPIFKIHKVPAKDVAIVMQGTGIVRGKVEGVDADPKRPTHVHITAAGGEKRGTWGGSARCQPDGSFEFRGVPPGDYVLSTRYRPTGQPADPNAVTVTITAGKTVEVTLRR